MDQKGAPKSGEAKPLTLWGWDIYIVVFAIVFGAGVLLAIVWLFFTDLPLPRHCGARGSSFCGWIDHRTGRELPIYSTLSMASGLAVRSTGG